MKVSLNSELSKKVGTVLKGLNIREEFLSRDILSINESIESKFRAFYYAVAICHQTYNLADRSRNLYGWDFIEDRFHHLIKTKSALLNPGYFSRLSVSEVKQELASLFETSNIKGNCTLDNLEERGKFLIETDTFFEKKFNGSIIKYSNNTDGRLINNGKGYYETLSILDSFYDPLNKKISFLLKLLLDSKLISIIDTENYIPIMDYHMMRVLLRIGCVEILDNGLYNDLVSRKPVNDDSEIRELCISSMRIISAESGHSIASMNDFFWPLGRSCCNEIPLCKSLKCEKSPCSFSEIVKIPKGSHSCIFENMCMANKDDKYLNLWQPNIVTHYY